MRNSYSMVRPCSRCPFRVDVPPYIRPERAIEIHRSLAGGGEFLCHETTIIDPDDETAMTGNNDSLVCAGSVITMLRGEEENQMLRIAERLGIFDRERIPATACALVSPSLREWTQRFQEEDIETCSVVGPNCEAPAGYMEGGSIIEGTEAAEYECNQCGQPVCDACSGVGSIDGVEIRLCLDCEGEW